MLRIILGASLAFGAAAFNAVAFADQSKPLTVSRFELRPGSQTLKLPADAFIVSAAAYQSQLSLWAAYTPGDQGTRDTPVIVIRSGEEFPANNKIRFIATIVDGTQAWHIFADN